MISLVYGILKSAENGRAAVSLPGYEGDAVVDAVLMLPGGGQDVKTWIAPVAGDQVAVLVDDERPEDSLVLGGVYTDSQKAPKSGARVAIQAPEVWIGADVSLAKKAARDDRVQSQLSAIKSALDSLVATYNAHTHTTPEGTSGTPTPATNGYSVGATAADSVWVK